MNITSPSSEFGSFCFDEWQLRMKRSRLGKALEVTTKALKYNTLSKATGLTRGVLKLASWKMPSVKVKNAVSVEQKKEKYSYVSFPFKKI